MPTKNSSKSSPKSRKKTSLRKELDLKTEASRPRRLKLPAYRPFRFQRIRYPEHLPSVWRITKTMTAILWGRRWLFLGMIALYGLLNLLFVRGLSGGTDVGSLKQQLSMGLGGNTGKLATGVTVFTSLLLSSGNNASATAGAYQVFLGLLFSLAIIWAVRQVAGGQSIRLRDAFYKGMYPLIPFILVLIVVLLQTIPLLIGAVVFGIVISSGIAASTIEFILWGLLFAVLAIITIYMLCASVFALYIVTLPDMTPLKALRSARSLVQYRRGQVLRKLLFLPLGLLIAAAIVMLPIILFAAPAAQWVFFVLSMFGLLLVHAYIYTLYKELLA